MGAVGDHKYKLAKERRADEHTEELAKADQETEQANQDREDAEFEAMRLGWLLTHLRAFVKDDSGVVNCIPNAIQMTIKYDSEGCQG